MIRNPFALRERIPFAPVPAVASVVLTVAVLAAFPPGGVPGATGGAGATLLLVAQGALADAGAVRDEIRAVGGSPLHVFPPDAVIAWLPDGAAAELGRHWPGLGVYAEGTLPPGADALAPAARAAASFWLSRGSESVSKSQSDASIGSAPPPLEHGRDALVRPGASRKGAATLAAWGGPPGAGFWDLSEFMLGDVSVSIIALESDGTLDPNSEDWTDPRYDKITTEVMAALDWWVARAGARPLSFTYHVEKVTTGFEPIAHPQFEEGLWITDAMSALGYVSGDYFERVAAFDNARRDADGTEWAVCAFVVDSWNDPDGKFDDGYFAYAYLGGPFLVMTSDNDGWGADNMDAVFSHELAHAFYALDEYAAAGVACTQRSGYLGVVNGNSALGGCPANVGTCVMRSSVVLGASVADAYTQGQVGWGDADVDGLSDILDTDPAAPLDPYVPNPNDAYHAAMTGQAAEVPLQNRNPNGSGADISLNLLTLVEWRVDGGTWSDAIPLDGAWDQQAEGFRFTTGLLVPGTHLIEARARNSAGNTQSRPDSMVIFIQGATSVDSPGEQGGLFATRLGAAAPNPARSETEISWTLGSLAEVSLTVHDLSGRRVRTLAGGVHTMGPHTSRWDGRDEHGREVASGMYVYRLVAPGFHDSKRLTVMR